MRSSRCPTTLCRATGRTFRLTAEATGFFGVHRLRAEATGFHLFCAAATGLHLFFRGFRLQAEDDIPRLRHDAR